MAGDDRERAADLSEVPDFLRRRSGGRPYTRPARAGAEPAEASNDPVTPTALDPASLPMPLSRRRLALVAVGLVVTLVLVGFGREVGDAAAASDRAAQLRATNATLRNELADLGGDVGRVSDERYIAIAARTYGMGAKHEIPFTLAADAPSLPPDAPGSAASRVGAAPVTSSPVDAWLELLFGPGR